MLVLSICQNVWKWYKFFYQIGIFEVNNHSAGSLFKRGLVGTVYCHPFSSSFNFDWKSILFRAIFHRMDKEIWISYPVLPHLDFNLKIENSNFFLTIFWGKVVTIFWLFTEKFWKILTSVTNFPVWAKSSDKAYAC